MNFKYENSRNPHEGTICHALNGGEKIVAGYQVDGFIQLKGSDGKPYTIVFEFMGKIRSLKILYAK